MKWIPLFIGYVVISFIAGVIMNKFLGIPAECGYGISITSALAQFIFTED
jgi:hypothetical protein